LSYTYTLSTAYTKFSVFKLTLSGSFYPDDNNKRYTILLTAPDTTTTLIVFSGTGKQLSSLFSKSGGTIIFSEGGYTNSEGVDNLNSVSQVRFFESLIKMSSANLNGDWVVTLSTQDTNGFTFTGTIQLDFGVTSPDLEIPQYPCYVSRSTSDKLSINYQEVFTTSNKLLLSPYLSTIFKISSRDMKYDSTLGMYEFIPDSVIYTADPFNWIRAEQVQSTLYGLINLRNIVVQSNILAGEGDVTISDITNNILGANTLYDFSISNDTDLGNYLEFSQTAVPYRLFSMKSSSGNLNNLDFTIIGVYSSGARKILQMPPNSKIQLRITFF
jgi:hypothetical protein